MCYALIKFQGAGLFGEVALHPGDTVSRLVDRACAKFSRGWHGVDATQLALHVVTLSGYLEPSEAAILAALATPRLGAGLPLELAGIAPGAWLVARRVPAGAPAASLLAAAAAGGHAPPPDPVDLLAAFHLKPLDERQQDALRHHDAFAGDRAQLGTGTFAPRFLPPLLMRLECVVASTTRMRIAASTGIVLDGPLSGAKGQPGTAILLALRDGEALCAKVGARAAVAREWQVSEAIHSGRAVPTVMRALLFEDVPSARGQGLLLMPLYPLSAAAARHALAPEQRPSSLLQGRLRCRDALAAKAALCGLAAIHAFAAAGWAHGDIKPANLMLSHGGAGEATPLVLIDFGAAQPVGEGLAESSAFGLEHAPIAGAAYDLACLATTVAVLQHPLPLALGAGSGAALLAALRAQDGAAAPPGAPRPPGSLAAELCLGLSYRARDSGGLGPGELRAAAEAVAEAAAAAGLRVPPVAELWARGPGREG
jgi:hypothetical protein